MSQPLQPHPMLDEATIAAAFSRVRDAIAADGLLADDARVGFSMAGLEQRLAGVTGLEMLWRRLTDGADQYRLAGLRVLQEALADQATSMTIPGPLEVETGLSCVAGDLHVGGDLVVPDDATLVVTGRLLLDGHLIAGFWSPVVAARRIEMASGISGGELLASEAIVASDRLYLCNNEHTCRSPRVEARVLVDFERSNAFGVVMSPHHVTRWDFDAAAAALGLPPDREGDLMTVWRRHLRPNN